MRYFEKQAFSFNPLTFGLTAIAKLISPQAAEKVIASKAMPSIAKWLGSSGTLETGLKSSVPQIVAASKPGGSLERVLKTNLGNRLNPITKEINPGTLNAFKEQMNPQDTFAKAWNSDSPIKNTAGHLIKSVTGIGDKNYGGNLMQSWRNDKSFMTAGGDVFQGSRLGNATKMTLQRGGDTYLLGNGLLGQLEEGETRTGRLLGNAGTVLGYRSSPKMFPGLARSIVYSTAASKAGNKIGIPKRNWNPYAQYGNPEQI